jgi:hypothetical protein
MAPPRAGAVPTEEVNTMKKPAMIVLGLFLGFYLMRDPTQLAHVSKTASLGGWNVLTDLFEAIITFLNALLR